MKLKECNLNVWDGTTDTTLFENASENRIGGFIISELNLYKTELLNIVFLLNMRFPHHKMGFYGWRGKSLYTSVKDWQTVFYQQLSTNDEPVGSIMQMLAGRSMLAVAVILCLPIKLLTGRVIEIKIIVLTE